MVFTREDSFGGVWPYTGEPAEPGVEPILEELDPETIKNTLETLKKFFPYIFAFGIAALVKSAGTIIFSAICPG